ncbi:MAG: hypothetical protein ACO3N4_06275 [Ilumatobacteraceae bacterium]
MATDLTLRAAGLYTDPNPHSDAPVGALRIADNVVIRRAGVLEPRPGFRALGLGGGARYVGIHPAPTGDTSEFYSQTIGSLEDDSGANVPEPAWTWAIRAATQAITQSGEYAGAHAAIARDALYVPTSSGVARVEDSVAVRTGYPRPGQVISAVASDPFSPVWLPTDNAVRYRVCFVRESDAGLIVRSAPSSDITATNVSGSDARLQLTLRLPPEIQAGDVVEVYRSLAVTPASVVPSDELYLAMAYALTASDISSGSTTFFDITEETDLGASLYTNATQQGILQANERPPQAETIAWFNQMLFFGRVQQPRQLVVRMVARPSAGQTLTINGLVYTFTASTYNPAAGDIPLNGPVPDIARLLCTSINTRSPGAGDQFVAAHAGDGTIVLYEPYLNANGAFDFVGSASGMIDLFDPPLETRTGPVYALSGSVEANAHRVMYSKLQEPEHVPTLNFVDIGSRSEPIMAMRATRRALFVFKTDGIWTIQGDTPETLRVQQIDSTARLLHPKAVAVGGDRVFAWTDAGVVMLGEGGVEANLSAPAIEPDLRDIQVALQATSDPAAGSTLGCFLAYQDGEERLLLGVPAAVGDDEAGSDEVGSVYVYDMRTQAWTRWTWETYEISAATSIGGRVLFVGLDGNGDGEAWRETLASDEAPHADITYTVSFLVISSQTSSAVTVTLASPVPPVGSWIYQASSATRGVVTGVSGSTVTIAKLSGTLITSMEGGDFVAYEPVQQCIEWVAKTAQAPTVTKHWQRGVLTYESDRRMYDATLSFRSDMVHASASVTTSHILQDDALPENAPFIVTRDHARAGVLLPKLCISQGGARWAISALHLDYELGSSRAGRRTR